MPRTFKDRVVTLIFGCLEAGGSSVQKIYIRITWDPRGMNRQNRWARDYSVGRWFSGTGDGQCPVRVRTADSVYDISV